MCHCIVALALCDPVELQHEQQSVHYFGIQVLLLACQIEITAACLAWTSWTFCKACYGHSVRQVHAILSTTSKSQGGITQPLATGLLSQPMPLVIPPSRPVTVPWKAADMHVGCAAGLLQPPHPTVQCTPKDGTFCLNLMRGALAAAVSRPSLLPT